MHVLRKHTPIFLSSTLLAALLGACHKPDMPAVGANTAHTTAPATAAGEESHTSDTGPGTPALEMRTNSTPRSVDAPSASEAAKEDGAIGGASGTGAGSTAAAAASY